jgi:integrase
VRKAFNWQATRDDDFKSPIVKGMARTKPKERARTRVLDDDEIRTLWRALDQWPADHGYPQLMRTMLLTGLRIDAASRGHAKEIRGDTWILPKDRTKQLGSDFLLPLSAPLKAMIAGKSSYLFSTDGGKTSISGFSKFKRQLDAKIKGLRRGHPMKHWTNHDLRRTARTLLSSLSTPDIAERCLAHVIPGVRGVYDLHDYECEKRDAFAALANRVLGIVDPEANVVALKLRKSSAASMNRKTIGGSK